MADDPKEKSLGVRSPEPGVEVAREAKERRRVAEIAREIEELGRALDERDRLARSDATKKTESMSGVANDGSSQVGQLATIPAIPEQHKLRAEGGRPTRRRKLWSSLAAAIIVLSLASAGALMPMGAWIETAQDAYRSAVAQTQRLMVRQNEGAETAAPQAPGENTMAEKAEQKATEEKLPAAVVARRADEETRQANEEKARTEAAREMTQAQARAAAQQAERKAAEEERAAAVAARRRDEENRQAAEEKARAEAARQARAAAQEAAKNQTSDDARLKSLDPPRKAVEEKSRSDAEIRKQAERAEVGLKLSEQDRKRVQVALNALGHPMPSVTGYFGPRTRAMITSWQKTQGLPDTGYLTEAQLATLLQRAAVALAEYDQAHQRKAKENPPDTE